MILWRIENVHRAVTASQRRDFIACVAQAQNSAHSPLRLQEEAVLALVGPSGPHLSACHFLLTLGRGHRGAAGRGGGNHQNWEELGVLTLPLGTTTYFIKFEGPHLLFVRNVLFSQMWLSAHIFRVFQAGTFGLPAAAPLLLFPSCPLSAGRPFRFGPPLPGQAFCNSWANLAPPLFSPGTS